MKFTRCYFSLTRGRAAAVDYVAWSVKPVLLKDASAFVGASVICLLFGLLINAQAQVSLFYDLPGNLVSQIPESTGPPVILRQPVMQVVSAGHNGSFAVVVADTTSVTYQWRFNGADLLGATADALLLTSVSAASQGNYSVVVANPSGSVTSSPAMLYWDSVGDGLPDSWKIKYFGSVTNVTTSGDATGDGVSNLQKFYEGTNPTNGAGLNPRLIVDGLNGYVRVSPDLDKFSLDQTVTLLAVPSPGFNFVGWSGDLEGANNPVTVTMTKTKRVTAVFGLPLDYSLNTTNVVWRSGGDVPWLGQNYVTYDGAAAAQSGPIGTNEQSWLEATVFVPSVATVNFWWKMASFTASLTVSVNGAPQSRTLSRSSDWQRAGFYLVPGYNVIRWTYAQNTFYFDPGFSAAWVDQVSFTAYPDEYIDTDFDGLPDLWELTQLEDLSGSGTADSDFDGVNNHDEYLYGTEPANPTSVFPRLTVTASGGRVALSPALTRYSYLQPVTLKAIPDPGFTFNGWSGDLAGATNPASLTMDRSKTVNAMFAMSTANALAEALDATNLTWSTGGDAPWFGQSSTNHDGIDAAQTPLLTDPAQQSWVRTTVTGPGSLSFWWKFAPSYDDLLEFSIDGIVQTNLSLMSDWQRMTFNVPAGAHVLQWTYHNSPYGEFAFSAAWLDQICFGPDVPCINNTLAAQTVLQGTDVMFTIDATGATPLSYQWQKDGTNLSDGGRISGATSRALTVSNVQTNDDAGIYSVRVSNTFGTAASAASLTVIGLAPLAAALDEPGWVWTSGGDAPWFGQTAVSKDGIAAARSGALTFDQSSWVQTTMTGPGKLSFWWKTSSTYGLDFLQLLVSGVTNASISGEVDWVPRSVIIPPGTQTIQWRYIQTFSFTESQETAWLDQITFTPGSPPEITSPPQPQAVAAGANVTFSITATGTSPLAYQWVHDGTNVPGATTTTLNLNSVQVIDAGSYAVIVSNSLGPVISPEAELTINGLPVITMQPSSQTARRGGKVTFSVAAAGTAPLSYQWQKNGTNIIGATPASLTLSDVQTADVGAYRVIVANLFGSATSIVANLTISLPPTLISQPQSQTVDAGANATFTVTATGDPPLTYQWLFEGAQIAGATDASLTLTNVQAFDAGNYAVLVSNPGGSVISSNAVLTVISPPVIFLQPKSINVEPGETAFFFVGAAGSDPLSYQWRRYDTNLPGATGSSLQLTNVQTSDAGPYTVIVSNSVGSVTSDVAWLTVGSAGLTLSITVSNSVANLDWNALAGHSYQVEYKADLATTAWSNLPPMITATGSNVAVSDFIGNSQRRFYRVGLLPQTNATPQILVQPVSQIVSAGANVAFSITATGSQPLQYQWQKDGTDLIGATTATLSLQNVQFSDIGIYSVVVSNFVDSVTSDAAFLFVQ